MWDDQTKVVDIVASENLLLTRTLTGLTSNLDYLFRVRAKNVYGYGEFSDTVTIRTSYVPDEMESVTT